SSAARARGPVLPRTPARRGHRARTPGRNASAARAPGTRIRSARARTARGGRRGGGGHRRGRRRRPGPAWPRVRPACSFLLVVVGEQVVPAASQLARLVARDTVLPAGDARIDGFGLGGGVGRFGRLGVVAGRLGVPRFFLARVIAGRLVRGLSGTGAVSAVGR